MTTEFLYPNMVQEYYVAKTRGWADRRRRERLAVTTPAEVLALSSRVRLALRQSFGEFPERTPLAAAVTGVLQRPAYRIENVVFESRPGLPVTANLYIPAAGTGPFPCVLGTCGHSQEGKAAGAYQAYAQSLATLGYMVLVYDPLNQGERVQYSALDGEVLPRGCCQEHNMMGNQMGLIGDCFAMWRVWDGIRALDYLLSRPEADRRHVGVTGNSGGGTLSTYLNAFDERFTMAAPSCFVTTFLRNLENELPADAEQVPANVIAYGLDMEDYFVARIPRPILLMGQRNDYFDCRGLRQTYAELRRLYGILGCADQVRLHIGPTNHGYSQHNREAMCRFFQSCVTGCDESVPEPPPREEPVEALWAVAGGQVAAHGCRRVYDFTRDRGESLARERRSASDAALPGVLSGVLRLPARSGPPHYRVLRSRGRDAGFDAVHSGFAVETEPGILALLHQFGSGVRFHLAAAEPAVLYVPHVSSQQEVAAADWPRGDGDFFAVDVRGVGQSTALTCADAGYFAPYGADYFYASYADMHGEPYVGRRTHDLLAVLDLLEDAGAREVHLVGRGMGALLAAYAAVLHPVVARVTLVNALLSFHELTQVPVQSWPKSAMVYRQLCDLDLPDCYRYLRRKSLLLRQPWNSRMAPWPADQLAAHAIDLGIADLVEV